MIEVPTAVVIRTQIFRWTVGSSGRGCFDEPELVGSARELLEIVERIWTDPAVGAVRIEAPELRRSALVNPREESLDREVVLSLDRIDAEGYAFDTVIVGGEGVGYGNEGEGRPHSCVHACYVAAAWLLLGERSPGGRMLFDPADHQGWSDADYQNCRICNAAPTVESHPEPDRPTLIS